MPIDQMRAAEAAQALGADGGTVATGCPFCLTTLHDGVAGLGNQGAVRVLDVAELVAKATRTAG